MDCAMYKKQTNKKKTTKKKQNKFCPKHVISDVKKGILLNSNEKQSESLSLFCSFIFF